MVNKVLICDIDGTICKYPTDEFVTLVKSAYGVSSVTDAEIKQSLSEKEYKSIKEKYRFGGEKFKVPVYPEAVEVINNLYEANVQIVFQTTRPPDPYIKSQTYAWLISSGFKFHNLIFNVNKKSSHFYSTSTAFFVIDDLSENFAPYLDLPSAHCLYFKNERLENHQNSLSNVKKVSSWCEIDIYLNSFI